MQLTGLSLGQSTEMSRLKNVLVSTTFVKSTCLHPLCKGRQSPCPGRCVHGDAWSRLEFPWVPFWPWTDSGYCRAAHPCREGSAALLWAHHLTGGASGCTCSVRFVCSSWSQAIDPVLKSSCVHVCPVLDSVGRGETDTPGLSPGVRCCSASEVNGSVAQQRHSVAVL